MKLATASIDLEIHVTTRENRLHFKLNSPNGKVAIFGESIDGERLSGSPEKYWEKIFDEIEMSTTGALETDELVRVGREIYREIFPAGLRRAYREFRHIETLLIVSDDPWIPWELVKPYDDSDPDDVIDDDFLCWEFQLTRWLRESRSAAEQIMVRAMACIDAGRSSDSEPLAHAAEECQRLASLARRHSVEDRSPPSATYEEVTALLEQGGRQLLHFTGHGRYDADQPTTSGFSLEDDRILRPRDLHGPIETTIKEDRPLVFLNACQAGQSGWSLTNLGGWAPGWVQRCGCGAFIAPQWTVDDRLACEFATAFYETLEDGGTFGEATKAARLKVRDLAPDDPSWLAYTVYAHPNGRLELGSVSSEVRAPAEVGPTFADAGSPPPPEPRRLTALLAWYLPDSKGFSRVCRSLGLSVWPLLLGWTPTGRWHEVVTFCETTGRLAELRRVAGDGFPAAAAGPLRDSRFETAGIPDLASSRREMAQRLRSILPGSLVAEGTSWTAEELLGYSSLRKIATVESSSAKPHDGLLELIRSSEVDTALEDTLRSGRILKCLEHLKPELHLPLAAQALVRLCEESPEGGRAAMRWTLEHLDQISGLQLDLTGWWLRWWPASVDAATSWLRKAVQQDPTPGDRMMARLSRLERLLLDAGAAPWSRTEDAPSLDWAARADLVVQLAALLENLGEERQSVYLKFFSETGRAARVPLALSLRRLAQIQGGFESLPPEPWATALRCSLPATTSDELHGMVRDDDRLNLWLSVLPQTLTDPQLDVLIEVFQYRSSSQRDLLAKVAGARLAAHPDPRAAWSRLRSAGRPWIRMWARERTPDEPMKAWLTQLTSSVRADPEIGILRQTWHDTHHTFE